MMECDDLKKKVIGLMLEKNVLVSEEFLEKVKEMDFEEFKKQVTEMSGDTLVLEELDKTCEPYPVDIKFSYEEEPKKRTLQDFISFFHSRYNLIKAILCERQDLENPISISRMKKMQKNSPVSAVGLVYSKNLTKNGNIMLTLEDPTDMIKVVISKNSKEVFALARNIVLDEVIGVVGNMGENIIFAKKVYQPDIPYSTEFKKSPDEAYSVFIGDMHFGSKVFYHEEFKKFLDWIGGKIGTPEQKKIVEKIHYVFLVGDLVEGVGIYPGQENDLDIQDIYEQYKEFAKYLKQIPERIKIIVCPGNHDAMRIAEPQPALYKDLAAPIHDIPNVMLVSNPALVNIHKQNGFEGFDVLMYHGFSFPYYADIIEEIRAAGGLKRADLIMKFLLQKRHLAPSHTSNLYIPDPKKDNLVIDSIPDFFVSGHIHRVSSSDYRNITMLNCSSWLAETEYQVKVGLKPEPARALLVNLQSREVKIMKFM